jgi:fatty-acyl-CoA synthase
MSTLLNVTIEKLLEEKVSLHPEHDAVIYSDRNLRWTYREFDDYCRWAAKGLMRLGIEKGEQLVAWSTNTPECYSIFNWKNGGCSRHCQYELPNLRT